MDEAEFNMIGVSLVDAVIAADFAKSRKQARQLIESGAIRIDGVKVTDSKSRLIMVDNTGYVIQWAGEK